METDKILIMEKLVDELMKEVPREKEVKKYMEEVRLPYTKDPMERLDMVLRALHFEEPVKSTGAEK